MPGVRLTLKGITTSPVSVNTTQAAVDTEAITKKITALVDAYNAVVTATRSELTEKKVPTASTTTDLQKGQLFGDSGMSSMLSSLKRTMTQTLTGLGLTGLADIGIGVPKSTGGAATEDAKAGKLTIDTDKLKTMLAADYTKVRDLFAGKGTDKGLSAAISDYVGTQTGTNGTITSRVNSDDAHAEELHEDDRQAQRAHGRPRKSASRRSSRPWRRRSTTRRRSRPGSPARSPRCRRLSLSY